VIALFALLGLGARPAVGATRAPAALHRSCALAGGIAPAIGTTGAGTIGCGAGALALARPRTHPGSGTSATTSKASCASSAAPSSTRCAPSDVALRSASGRTPLPLLAGLGAALVLAVALIAGGGGRASRVRARRGERPPLAVDGLAPRRRRALGRAIRRVSAGAPQLHEGQRRRIDKECAAGRFGPALELCARVVAENGVDLSPGARSDLAWAAATLGVEDLVLPLFDHAAPAALEQLEVAPGPAPARGVEIGRGEFEDMVVDAVAALPAQFHHDLENVAFIVEERADSGALYGRYEGIPLPKRWSVDAGSFLDRIHLYRRTICAACSTPEEVRDLVYVTVVHEVAHHFGVSEKVLRSLGWDGTRARFRPPETPGGGLPGTGRPSG
jgi:predicted Zn-dependent protease with MMP-like domain